VHGVDPGAATARFNDGTERAAELVVAAEGGQSSTREQLFPEVSPTVADYVAWRGVVPESELPGDSRDTFDDTFTFFQGAHQLVLAYFIPGPDGSTAAGERRLNWVWYDTLDGRDRRAVFTDTSGTERRFTVPPGRLRAPIATARRERAKATLPPVFRTLVAETSSPFVQAIYDLSVPEMVRERVCLLGDSAFVARPHTAAGTAKAVGDAEALAEAADDSESLGRRLASWSESRTAYGTELVRRGTAMGEERLGLDTS
jgi:2-polyprenyl-6-methoxyphenol hydroxylase-like FAD-dependent oxidoreductase